MSSAKLVQEILPFGSKLPLPLILVQWDYNDDATKARVFSERYEGHL